MDSTTISRLHSSERIFTLADWQHMTKATVTLLPSGTYYIPDCRVHGQWRWELFHLKDYVVSSVSAGTIWLVERQQMEVAN